jgi:transcriptional regulator with PAS, ATPase and Fis domain
MSRSASDSTTNLVLDFVGYELLVTRDGAAFSVPLPSQGELLIGRAEEAQVRLTGTGVSRRHATLRIGPSGIRIADLGSSNGTQLRGERLEPGTEHSVSLGESVLLGDFVLTLRPRRGATPLEDVRAELRDSGGDAMFVRVSRSMEALLRQTDPVARSKIPVLILGETGVGKDVLARSIHERSDRAQKPFLRLNCAALSEALLESELFGYEKGAFTGAAQAKPGLLLAASGGTVFLDEVGELPARLQPKLLQVLETQEILSLGSVRPKSIDVRFIAATNRNLGHDMASAAFRSDLYYRLAGFTALIPPLRERREDILPLAREFLRLAGESRGPGSRQSLSPSAESLLLEHSWPGNVRELRNVIERAVVICEGSQIGVEHVELTPFMAESSSVAPENGGLIAELSAKELEDRQRILDALTQCSGNQSKAAEKLGISRSTLINRLDAYRIGRPRKRPGG